MDSIGTGYITEACKSIGVSNSVFYTGKKKLEKGERLTKKEIAVLTKHKELLDKAKKRLKNLKE